MEVQNLNEEMKNNSHRYRYLNRPRRNQRNCEFGASFVFSAEDRASKIHVDAKRVRYANYLPSRCIEASNQLIRNKIGKFAAACRYICVYIYIYI